jgi:hypothetical protein
MGGSEGTAPYQIQTYQNGAAIASTSPVLDTSIPTTYILTYHAIDGAGNTATAYRSVIVGNQGGTVSLSATSTPTGTTDTSTTTISIVDTATTTTSVTDTATTTQSVP